jgi:hypothetical protein
VRIWRPDLARLKLQKELARTSAFTWLALADGLVEDLFGNIMPARDLYDALQVGHTAIRSLYMAPGHVV